jgi:hypothetical protein
MSGCVHYEMNLKKKQVVIKMYNQSVNEQDENESVGEGEDSFDYSHRFAVM